MNFDTARVAQPRLRLKPAAVASWLALVASLIWWATDATGEFWPVIAVVLSAGAVVKAVDDAWVTRTLRRRGPRR
jgi:hypothetical protein